MSIQGGYILTARKTLESDLMSMSPLAFKLFFWMLLKANWRDREKIRRGQLVTTIEEMREVGSYLVGYRKEKPSKDQTRSAYEALTKATMITTAKTTRGMVITINNYDVYQSISNYEAHNEPHSETLTKPLRSPHDTEEGKKEIKKDTLAHPKPERMKSQPKEMDSDFNAFWQAYPRKRSKGQAIKAWAKLNGTKPPIDVILNSIAAMKAGHDWSRDPKGEFIKHPATWLNAMGWEDTYGSGQDTAPAEDRNARRRKLWEEIPDEWKAQAAPKWIDVLTPTERRAYGLMEATA